MAIPGTTVRAYATAVRRVIADSEAARRVSARDACGLKSMRSPSTHLGGSVAPDRYDRAR